MKYFKTFEGYRYGVNGVGSLRNSLAALKRQNINGRYVDPEILAQGIRNEYEAITGEKYEDEVQMSMDNTIADIIGHFKLDGPEFMAAWDKVVKESVNEAKDSFYIKQLTDTFDKFKLNRKYEIMMDSLFGGGSKIAVLRKRNTYGDGAMIDTLHKDGGSNYDGYIEILSSRSGRPIPGKSKFDNIDDAMKAATKYVDSIKESVNENEIKVGDIVYRKFPGEDSSQTFKVISISGRKAKLKDNKTGKQNGMYLSDLVKESVNESNQQRLTHLRKFGIAPNNQPQNAAYIKQVSKPGKFFVDWKDAFKLGDVALEFIKSVGSISEFDIIDLKTMKRTGKQLDVKKGQLGNLRTTYGVRVNESVNESYEGNFTDFKYDLEMAIDNMGISPKAIKAVKKKGKGYEVRLSSYMSDKSTWEKIGDTIGATLISFKPGSINIGIYE